MNDLNVSTVRTLYRALAARDLEAFASLLHDDVDWRTPAIVPWGGNLQGVDAVRGYVTDVWGFFEDYDNEPSSFTGRGDLVVVHGAHRGRRGARVHEIPYADVCTVRDGQVVGWRQQVDAGEIMRAIADQFD